MSLEEKDKHTKRKKTITVLSIICITLVVALIAGIYSLMDYINMPKVLFYSAVDESYEDFTDMMSDFKSNNLYQTLSSEKMKVNTTYDVKVEDFYDGKKNLDKIFNSLEYKSISNIDRTINYMDANFTIMENENQRSNIKYVDKDFKRYIFMSSLSSLPINLSESGLNIEAFDAEASTYLGDIIKRNLLYLLEEERFASTEETIDVDLKSVDCKVSSYTLDAFDASSLLEKIVEEIKNNKNVHTYLASLMSMSEEDLDKTFKTLDETIIEGKKEYKISAYTSIVNDEAVRLEFSYKNKDDEDVIYRYSKKDQYKELYRVVGEDKTLLSLDKSNKNEQKITYVNNEHEVIFTLDNESKGTITYKNKTEVILDAKFSYALENKDVSTKLTVEINSTIQTDNKPISLEITANSTIKKIDKVVPIEVNEDVKLKDFEESEKDSLFNLILRELKMIDID